MDVLYLGLIGLFFGMACLLAAGCHHLGEKQ